MRFHKKIIDGATHFSDFQTVISALSMLIDLAYVRNDLLLTLSMITFSLLMIKLHTCLLKFLRLFISLIWIMSLKGGIFFFFFIYFFFIFFADSPFKVSLKNIKFNMLQKEFVLMQNKKWREHTP